MATLGAQLPELSLTQAAAIHELSSLFSEVCAPDKGTRRTRSMSSASSSAASGAPGAVSALAGPAAQSTTDALLRGMSHPHVCRLLQGPGAEATTLPALSHDGHGVTQGGGNTASSYFKVLQEYQSVLSSVVGAMGDVVADMRELEKLYHVADDRTTEVRQACVRLVGEQQGLVASAARLRAHLAYYDEADRIAATLQMSLRPVSAGDVAAEAATAHHAALGLGGGGGGGAGGVASAGGSGSVSSPASASSSSPASLDAGTGAGAGGVATSTVSREFFSVLTSLDRCSAYMRAHAAFPEARRYGAIFDRLSTDLTRAIRSHFTAALGHCAQAVQRLKQELRGEVLLLDTQERAATAIGQANDAMRVGTKPAPPASASASASARAAGAAAGSDASSSSDVSEAESGAETIFRRGSMGGSGSGSGSDAGVSAAAAGLAAAAKASRSVSQEIVLRACASQKALVEIRAAAAAFSPLFREVERRAGANEAYRALVHDCHAIYFSHRRAVLVADSERYIKRLAATRSVPAFFRTACSFLVDLCAQEARTARELFATRTARSTQLLRELLEALTGGLYTALRPLLVREGDVDVLCEVITIVKLEFGALVAPQGTAGGAGASTSPRSSSDGATASPSAAALGSASETEGSDSASGGGGGRGRRDEGAEALSALLHRVLQDSQERLVFRAQAYLREAVEVAEIVDAELDYPRSLHAQHGQQQQQQHGAPLPSTGALSSPSSSASSQAGPSSPGVPVTSPSSGAARPESRSLFAGWYRPLERTLLCLSKLYRCLDREPFRLLAQQAVEAGQTALQRGAALLARREGSLHSSLFLVKNLIILREQLCPFQVEFATTERTLDFSNLRSLFGALRGGGGGAGTAGGAGAAAAGSPASAAGGPGGADKAGSGGLNGHVSPTAQGGDGGSSGWGGFISLRSETSDARRSLVGELRRACEAFIGQETRRLVGPLLDALRAHAGKSELAPAEAAVLAQLVLTGPCAPAPAATSSAHGRDSSDPAAAAATAGEAAARAGAGAVGVAETAFERGLRALTDTTRLYIANAGTEAILLRPVRDSVIDVASRASALLSAGPAAASASSTTSTATVEASKRLASLLAAAAAGFPK